MAEGSVGSVWHKSLANLPSIDTLLPSFLICRKLMKIQFFARSFLYSSLYHQSFVQNIRQLYAMIVCVECLVFISLQAKMMIS